MGLEPTETLKKCDDFLGPLRKKHMDSDHLDMQLRIRQNQIHP